MVSIHDIAKQANVSTSTVSKALSGDKYRVSEATRKRVLDAVTALGFVASKIGETVISRNQNILVAGYMMIPGINDGIWSMSRELGYDATFINTALSDEYPEKLRSGAVRGAIFINLLNESELISLAGKYPVVQCGEYIEFPKSISVSINNEKAAYELTSLLIERGCRRFGLAMAEYLGTYKYNMSQQRISGFMRALTEHNLDFCPELARNFTYSDDPQHAKDIAAFYAGLPAAERPDAIICEQDKVSLACVNTLRLAGISVPGEVAVACFDDTILCQLSEPTITAVRHPYFEMGRDAMRLLDSIITGELSSGRHVFIDHEIIVRGSTPPATNQ